MSEMYLKMLFFVFSV